MNIALIGYGKMGRSIESVAIKNGHTITCKISSQNLHEFNPRVLKWTDVAIEFSSPECAFDNIYQCIEMGLPVVSGTTGWIQKMKEIEEYCIEKNGSFLYASNFSIGVNIFFDINRRLAKMMNHYPKYDIHIKESHHVHKADQPSGTAITLAQDIIEEVDRKKVWTITEPVKNSRELYIESERIGDVPGTHHISYTSEVDDIELIHTAHIRSGFATGAVLAAEWLAGRKGVFSMSDVLASL